MADHTVVIVNPQAGGGSLGRRWVEISEVLRRALGSFDDARTESAGDATRLAASAIAEGADTVVAIGGDGTVNEVVNGFFSNGASGSRCALGVIPFGTGGDFRKTVGLSKDLDTAARVVAARRLQTIDVGKLEYTNADGARETRMFANIASFGLSGEVDDLVNQSTKRLGGRLSFMLATARAGMRYQNQRVSLRFDDEAETREMTVSTVAIANGRYFGGGMKVAPDASIDDGYFDVVAIGDMSLMDFVLHGHKLYRGTHLDHPKISCRRARAVAAEPLGDEPVRLDVDGETPGSLPARFELVPAALQLIVP